MMLKQTITNKIRKRLNDTRQENLEEKIRANI